MCGFAGRAVNPSMGAREPHPCGTTVPPTHTPHASDSWLVAMEMKSRCRAERIPAGLNAPSRASHARQASLAKQAGHARACKASRQVKASEANRQTSTPKHARATASPGPALSLRTSPLSKGGHGWVGGTMCCHGWQHMSLHGRTCSGSRQPTRACPARHEPAHPLLTYCRRCCCAKKEKSRDANQHRGSPGGGGHASNGMRKTVRTCADHHSPHNPHPSHTPHRPTPTTRTDSPPPPACPDDGSAPTPPDDPAHPAENC